MTEKFYVTADGTWIGAVEGMAPPGGIEWNGPAPASALQKLVDGEWWPETVPGQPKIPEIFASAKLSISDGIVSGFAAESAIAGGFAIDTGKFWMFFGEEQPDTDYIVNPFGGGPCNCYVQPEDYMTDSFVITATDMADNPFDPASISLTIMRAV